MKKEGLTKQNAKFNIHNTITLLYCRITSFANYISNHSRTNVPMAICQIIITFIHAWVYIFKTIKWCLYNSRHYRLRMDIGTTISSQSKGICKISSCPWLHH